MNTLNNVDKKVEAEATKALSANPIHTLRVYNVVDCHKTLLKTPNFKDATFKKKAKEIFPDSTYFNSV